MNKEKLKNDYENAANAYLKAFCIKHDFDFDPDCWVGSIVGEIADVSGYFVDMSTIRTDIHNDASVEQFLKWYDYCSDMRMLGCQTVPNFLSWIRGCPRKTDEEIERFKLKHNELEDLRKILEEEINKENF